MHLPPALSSRLRAPALLLVLAVLVGLAAPSAGAVVVHRSAGHFAGLAPRRGASQFAASAATASSGSPASYNLAYHNGPVLHSSAPYLVYWDPARAIAGSSRGLLARYLADTAAASGGATDVYAVNRQFTDAGGFADNRQSFSPAQVIDDTAAFPARDTTTCANVAPTYPNCLTDAQITAELGRLQATRGLPTGTGENAPVYIVLTPPDTNVCQSATQCADNIFCAYHSAFGPASSPMLYSVVPMFFDGASGAQNPKACQSDGTSPVQQPNGDLADVAIKALSHELSETITDPLGTAWYNDATGNEDGDNCNFTGSSSLQSQGGNVNAFLPVLGGSAAAGTLYDQLISGHPYYTQTEWSNATSNCEAQPTVPAPRAVFSAPASANPGDSVTFDPGGSTSTAGLSSVTWDFGDGSRPSFSRTTAASAVAHTYTAARLYTVTLTLVDADGNLATATRQVAVGVPAPAPAPTPAPAPAPAPATQPAPTPPAASPSPAASNPTTPPTVTVPPPPVIAPVAVPPVAVIAAHVTFVRNGWRVIVDARGSRSGAAGLGAVRWNFGDLSTGAGLTAAHLYRHPGRYLITLTIVAPGGGLIRATRTVRLDGMARAAWIRTARARTARARAARARRAAAQRRAR